MRRSLLFLACTLAMTATAQEQPPADAPAPEAAPKATDAIVTDAPPAPADESGTIYRSVGEDGSIVFSDKPSPGAKKVEVQEMQTIEAPPPPSFVYERPQPEPGPAYTRVAIVDPANDAEIRKNTGTLTVSVAVEPALFGSDRLVLLVDGQEAAAGAQTSFTLANVDRGSHELTAVVRSADGKTLQTSPAVTFHMLRFFEPPPKPAPKPKPK